MFLVAFLNIVEVYAQLLADGVPQVHLSVQEIDVYKRQRIVAGVHFQFIGSHIRHFQIVECHVLQRLLVGRAVIYAEHTVHEAYQTLDVTVALFLLHVVGHVIVIVRQGLHCLFHGPGRRSYGIGTRTLVKNVPAPRIVTGSFDHGVSLDFALHVAGVILILVYAHRRILCVDSEVPVVVDTL